MRQQQQQRSRNRNRGRKSSNPLSKNFESNGPDVKIRGNANHIAEKYSVLARDALTSGDTVMAENYFQHAEHYFRIVANAQQNSPQTNVQNNGQDNRQSGDGSRNTQSNNNVETKGDGPQPEMSEVPAEIALKPENTGNLQGQVEEPDVKPTDDDGGRNRRNGRRVANTRRTSRVSAKKESQSGNDGDGLSKDAASLPSGLIGAGDDGEVASASSDD